MYEISFSKKALKDIEKLKLSKLDSKAKELIEVVKIDPYMNPPPYERLSGDLKLFISRRINIQHRLVYRVLEDEKVVRVYRMWTHYDY